MKVFPETLNQYPVVKAEAHTNGWTTVMVHRADDPMEYVVASWWPSLGTQWSWGHYCHDKAEADDEFALVARRNEARGNINQDRANWQNDPSNQGALT